MIRPVRLDDWYRLINSIYVDRNFYRTTDSVFCHLVEIVGGLSIVASGKFKEGVVADRFLAKAVGWWLALCGKVGVKSPERLVWSKFPYVCTYCHLEPHRDAECRRIRGGSHAPNWHRLAEIGHRDVGRTPRSVSAWMLMFNRIYERGQSTSQEMNFSRLAEELGELAEAVRAFPVSRGYFLSEAADVFAWLMGVGNQMQYKLDRDRNTVTAEEGRGAFLEEALWSEYPAQCRYCLSRVCKCAPFPSETLGRIAKEAPTSGLGDDPTEPLFTVQEMLEHFRVGDEAIRVGGQTLRVTPELIGEIRSTSRQLLSFLHDLSTRQVAIGADVVAAAARIELLASREEVTQQSIDNLRSAIEALPSEARSTLLGFVTNMGASGWFYALMKAVGG
jgi:hypothetical protein